MMVNLVVGKGGIEQGSNDVREILRMMEMEVGRPVKDRRSRKQNWE